MQKQLNIRLIIALAFVISAIIILPYFKTGSHGLQVDKRMFTLHPQTVITDVVLKTPQQTNRLSYVNGQWLVNETYPLDINMRDVFFSVLSQLEIRRAVPASLADSTSNYLQTKGVEVTVLNNTDTVQHYIIGGNKATQQSFIVASTNKPYLVHIPGYRSYVAGIFQVPEADWRSRLVFTTQFTNLNTLKVKYAKDSLNFRYKNSFFEIEGMQADSTQLITALEDFLFIQTDQYLQPSELAAFQPDSLVSTPPLVTITCTQLSGTNETLRVYPTRAGKFYLALSPDSSYCVLNKKRFNKILRKRADFE